MSGTDGERSVMITYDPDSCDEFVECLARVTAVCNALEEELGQEYADEYRRQLCDFIMTNRDAVLSPGARRGLTVGVDGTRRALHQPMSASLPGWQHERRSGPSARQ